MFTVLTIGRKKFRYEPDLRSYSSIFLVNLSRIDNELIKFNLRLAQFKWKKRLEEEIKSKKEVKVQKEVPVFLSDDRLPHQVFDSSKKTWLKGEFMQMYMAQLVNQGEFSGSSFAAPRSVGMEGNLSFNSFFPAVFTYSESCS